MARGHKTGGGSRKGVPNKVTTELKAAIQEAFVNVGGAVYLQKVAQDNPAVFCKLLGMTLPKDVKLEGTLTLEQLLIEAAQKRVTA